MLGCKFSLILTFATATKLSFRYQIKIIDECAYNCLTYSAAFGKIAKNLKT